MTNEDSATFLRLLEILEIHSQMELEVKCGLLVTAQSLGRVWWGACAGADWRRSV